MKNAEHSARGVSAVFGHGVRADDRIPCVKEFFLTGVKLADLFADQQLLRFTGAGDLGARCAGGCAEVDQHAVTDGGGGGERQLGDGVRAAHTDLAEESVGEVLLGDDDLRDDLVLAQRGLFGGDDVVVHEHTALAVHAREHHLRVHQDKRLGHIALGGRVADVAADGRAVAQGDRAMRDAASFKSSGAMGERAISAEVVHAPISTLPSGSARDALELLEVGDDENVALERGRHARAHAVRDHQVGAAGEDGRTGLLADTQRLLKRFGNEALYLFHKAAPFFAASRMHSTIRS